MGEDGCNRKGLMLSDLDLAKLVDGDDDGEPQPPVVISKSQRSSLMDEQTASSELQNLTDDKLIDFLERTKKYKSGLFPKLKDGGEKLEISIKKYENELKRRRLKNVDDGLTKPLHLQNQNGNADGLSHGVLNRASSAVSPAQSRFGSLFCNHLDGKTGSTTANAFDKELSTLNRCNRHKMQSDKQSTPNGRKKRRLSLRDVPFRSPGHASLNIDEKPLSSGYQKDRIRPARSPHLSVNSAPQGRQYFTRLRHTKGETVVLVDEEEEPDVEEVTPQEIEVHERFSENTIIYYPSRKDPGSVEIGYSDIKCLAPEAYLSSPVMNFYIRYLEEEGIKLKTAVEENRSYYFFNTYFYDKLKEAVDNKNINDNPFAKLRRWWRGVNLYEKAYIFLPIHEQLHWSLVIVCMPQKEVDSEILLLHLDSLGLHQSSSIFKNIKSFLKEEWKFLRQGEVIFEPPVADSIWENLPRRIFGQTIEVPQQRNEYDCGLFVLFFMERFIEDAPGRLKRNDLEKFGRHWFNPADASRLRKTIRKLLLEKFENASEENQVTDL
ncbi:OLC1v1028257C1 [Oldenlandia corymbosa var. corymbosa]|uniref:OLC1v1028257C1 n=1 Tax=Oldenlandia corymbosa var. corymbosa TaxID=529605 RepID=A0AAV1CBB1_OLDCO|nr:OLC1v1028257C1 [Oldenlandia corymbosa var. corymbosa]